MLGGWTLGRPALLEEGQQMGQSFVIGLIFLGSQLPGPFIQLPGHFQSFVRGTTQTRQDLAKLCQIHD